jgi:flagella basal body P-ring formation protein FlgA
MRCLFIAISAGALLASECIRVSSNAIAVGDLAGAVPLLRSLDPKTVIGFTPVPGVERILSTRELLAIARQQGLQPEAGVQVPSVCVERAAYPIDPEQLDRVLQTALGVPAAHLVVLDFSRQPVPAGRMEFSISGLNKPPDDAPSSPIIWRGRLVYEGQRSLSIWAKVRVTVERGALIASEQIPAGSEVGAGQVEMRVAEEFPFSLPALDSVSQAVGKTTRRTIPAGQRIAAAALMETSDVVRGATVRVEAIDGQALLTLDAVAESSGRKGDQVTLRNPSTGRTFRGIVQDKGKVIVRPSPGDEF